MSDKVISVFAHIGQSEVPGDWPVIVTIQRRNDRGEVYQDFYTVQLSEMKRSSASKEERYQQCERLGQRYIEEALALELELGAG